MRIDPMFWVLGGRKRAVDVGPAEFCFWLSIILINFWGIAEYLKCGAFQVDQAETVYHAREVLAGRVLHRDSHLHHFGGYLLPFIAVSYFKEINPSVYWLLNGFFNLAGAFLVYLTISNISTRKAARMAALLAVSVGWLHPWEGHSFNNQSFVVPFIYSVLYCGVRTLVNPRLWALLLGCFGLGLVASMDQRLVTLVLPSALVWHYSRASFTIGRRLAAAFMVLVMPIILLAYLMHHSALHEFWEQTIAFAVSRRNSALGVNCLTSAWALIERGFATNPLVVLAAMLGLIGIVFVEAGDCLRRYLLCFILALLPAPFLGGRPYLHYLVFLAPALILCLSLAPNYALRLGMVCKKAINLALLTLVAVSVCRPLINYVDRGSVFLRCEDETAKSAAAFIKSLSQCSGRVMIWGYAPQIHLYAGTFSAFYDLALLTLTGGHSGYVPFVSEGMERPDEARFREFMERTPPEIVIAHSLIPDKAADVLSRDPAYVVLYPYVPAFDLDRLPDAFFVKKMLRSRYIQMQTVVGETDKAQIYVRRGFCGIDGARS